jgi:hypothetical protein
MSTTNDSTISLIPKKCQLTVTMAFIPSNILLRLILMMGGYHIMRRRITRMVQNELEEYVTKAEQREKEISYQQNQ